MGQLFFAVVSCLVSGVKQKDFALVPRSHSHLRSWKCYPGLNEPLCALPGVSVREASLLRGAEPTGWCFGAHESQLRVPGRMIRGRTVLYILSCIVHIVLYCTYCPVLYILQYYTVHTVLYIQYCTVHTVQYSTVLYVQYSIVCTVQYCMYSTVLYYTC